MAQYTQKEYRLAREVNILDYLRDSGYELGKTGNQIFLKEHDSLRFTEDGRWFWHSRGFGGRSPITLLKELNGDNDVVRAIKDLAAYSGGSFDTVSRSNEKKSEFSKSERIEFQLPEANENNRRVFSYLTKTRGIDSEIVSQCINRGLLYESKDYHNVVFVGQKDETGAVRYASLRGTYTNAQKPFKGDVGGSEKKYGFAMEGSNHRLLIFESAIDALSDASLAKLRGENWEQDHRLALSGISDDGLELYLKRYPDVKHLVFCMDNDLEGRDSFGNPRNHGQVRANDLLAAYQARGYACENRIPAVGKDINDELMEFRKKEGREKEPKAPDQVQTQRSGQEPKKVQTTEIKQPMNEAAQRRPEPSPIQNEVIFPGGRILKIDELKARLEKGVKEIFTQERYKEYLRVMSRFHKYSVNNTVLIFTQNPNATYIAGYEAWKKNFSRQVNAGEKGIRILAPIKRKRVWEEEAVNPKTRQKEIVTKEEKIVIGYRAASVFDISQTRGKELPKLVNVLQGSVKSFSELMEAIRGVSKFPISIEAIPGNANGYCSYQQGKIAIQENMSEAQTLKTAIHELAHSRQPENQDRQMKEIEAESIAFVVCEAFGLDTSEYSFPYIASWAGKNEKKLQDCLSSIQKESESLIEELKEQLEKQEKLREASLQEQGRVVIEPSEIDTALQEGVTLMDMEGNPIAKMDGYQNLQRNEKKPVTIDMSLLDKDSEKYTKTRERFASDMFRFGFEKDPLETLHLFGIPVPDTAVNRILCMKDPVVLDVLQKETSVDIMCSVILNQLKEMNKIPGKVKVEIDLENDEKPYGFFHTLQYANDLFSVSESMAKESGGLQSMKVTLYAETGIGVWESKAAEVTFGKGEFCNLMDLIEKTMPENIVKAAKREMQKQERQQMNHQKNMTQKEKGEIKNVQEQMAQKI